MTHFLDVETQALDTHKVSKKTVNKNKYLAVFKTKQRRVEEKNQPRQVGPPGHSFRGEN